MLMRSFVYSPHRRDVAGKMLALDLIEWIAAEEAERLHFALPDLAKVSVAVELLSAPQLLIFGIVTPFEHSQVDFVLWQWELVEMHLKLEWERLVTEIGVELWSAIASLLPSRWDATFVASIEAE